jgi:hypothetical protein
MYYFKCLQRRRLRPRNKLQQFIELFKRTNHIQYIVQLIKFKQFYQLKQFIKLEQLFFELEFFI